MIKGNQEDLISYQKPSINQTLKHHLKGQLRHQNLNHFLSSSSSQTLTHD